MGLPPVTRADNAARLAATRPSQAASLIEASRLPRGQSIDTARLAGLVADAGARDPATAAQLAREVNARLPVTDQARFQSDLARALAQRGAPAQTGVDPAVARQRQELALDVAQMVLDIAGLFDPTPVSDGTNAIISLFRGDLLGAGLSAVSIIPFLGDAAKLGKLGRWAQTIERAVDLARADGAFARLVRPQLEQLGRALSDIAPDVLARLPQPVQDFVRNARARLAEFLPPPARISRADFDSLPPVSGPGVRVKPVGGAWASAPNWDNWTAQGGKIISHADGSVTYIRRDLVQVRYNSAGYPDFTPHLDHPSGVRSVEVPHSRNRANDFEQANIAAGRPEWGRRSPPDYTWHHHENGTTMQLVPRAIHNGTADLPRFSHAGGVANVPGQP